MSTLFSLVGETSIGHSVGSSACVVSAVAATGLGSRTAMGYLLVYLSRVVVPAASGVSTSGGSGTTGGTAV